MVLDKKSEYVFRIGSNNQYRIFWKDTQWCYEFLAGGVLFDEQFFKTEEELAEALSFHGMTLSQFHVDVEKKAAAYSQVIQSKIKMLQENGIEPCPKHGLVSKNPDNTCEACSNTDFPDDHKGTEG